MVKYKKTGLEGEVHFRDDADNGLFLVGNANLFSSGEPNTGEEWFVTPEDFSDGSFVLTKATDAERVRLRTAGFQLELPDIPVVGRVTRQIPIRSPPPHPRHGSADHGQRE